MSQKKDLIRKEKENLVGTIFGIPKVIDQRSVKNKFEDKNKEKMA